MLEIASLLCRSASETGQIASMRVSTRILGVLTSETPYSFDSVWIFTDSYRPVIALTSWKLCCYRPAAASTRRARTPAAAPARRGSVFSGLVTVTTASVMECAPTVWPLARALVDTSAKFLFGDHNRNSKGCSISGCFSLTGSNHSIVSNQKHIAIS